MTASAAHRDLALVVIPGALFVVLIATTVSGLASPDVIGLYLSQAVAMPAIVLVLGLARHRRGRRDGRGIMALAAAGIAVMVAIILVVAGSLGGDNPTTSTALLIGSVALAGLVAVLVAPSPPATPAPVRTPLHRLGLTVLAGSLVFSVGAIVTMGFQPPLEAIVVATMPAIVSLVLLAVAWWWGVGWVLAVVGIGRFALLPLLASGGGSLAMISAIAQGGLYLILAARPPRSATKRSVPPAPAGPRPPLVSTSAVVWAALGSLLLVPTLLMGPLAARLIDCVDCGPPSPLARPAIAVNLVALIGLPLLTATLVAIRRRGRGPATGVAWLGLVLSAAVFGQAMLSITSVPGFEDALSVGPAALMAMLGFGAAIARPAILLRVALLPAILCGFGGLTWLTQAVVVPDVPIDFAALQVGAMVTGVLVTLALAREFAIEPVADIEPAPAVGEPVHEDAEPVDTSAVTASIHRVDGPGRRP